MFFINCALFNSFKAYIVLSGKSITYKNFLHKVAVSLIENCETNHAGKDNDLSNSKPTRRTPRLDHPGRLPNFGKHKLINIVTNSQSVKPKRQCRVCAVQKKKREVEHVLPVNFAIFHYTKAPALNNIILKKNI